MQSLFCGATDQLTSSVSPSVTYQRGRGYQEAVRAGSSEESHEDAHSRWAPRRKKTRGVKNQPARPATLHPFYTPFTVWADLPPPVWAEHRGAGPREGEGGHT